MPASNWLLDHFPTTSFAREWSHIYSSDTNPFQRNSANQHSQSRQVVTSAILEMPDTNDFIVRKSHMKSVGELRHNRKSSIQFIMYAYLCVHFQYIVVPMKADVRVDKLIPKCLCRIFRHICGINQFTCEYSYKTRKLVILINI